MDQLTSDIKELRGWLVLTYLDLFCAMHGIDLGRAAVQKFNEVSIRGTPRMR